MSTPPIVVSLRAGHYAFMRAVVQGLDWHESWLRYLAQDDVPADAQAVRTEIERIRWAFAAAARRARRPGLARLVLLDAEALPDTADNLPSLEDFAIQAGLEDFSYQEQVAAYAERYGTALPKRRGAARRARIVARQLEALTWLEAQSRTLPIDGDPITAWLAPGLCRAMAAVGIVSMGDLKAWIAQRGDRWMHPLRSLGPVKGARLLTWLREQGMEPMSLHKPRTPARPRGTGRAKSSVASPGTDIRPLELYFPPPALKAARDIEGIVAWVGSVAKVTACGRTQAVLRPSCAQDLASGPLSPTQKCYRREAERLLLWAHLVRGCSLMALSRSDCVAYLDFLQNPAPRFQWCGPRGGQRWSATWRPFEGPLSAPARQQSLVILRGLFRFLQEHPTGAYADPSWPNPWQGVAVLDGRRRRGRAAAAPNRLGVHAIPLSSSPALPADVRNERARVAWLCRQTFGLGLHDIAELTWNELDRLIRSRPTDEATIAHCNLAVLQYRLALEKRLAASSLNPAAPMFPRLPQVATSEQSLSSGRPVDALAARSHESGAHCISASALCQDLRRLKRLGIVPRLSD